MSTIAQSWVSRCRDDFTTNSATVVAVTGTRRRLLGLTAGNYLDIVADASFAISVGAANAKASIYLGATVAAMAAVGEAGATSVAATTNFGSLSMVTRYGPITAAQAASGLYVDMRISTSANTLSISAKTTPTGYSAVLRVNEMAVAATLPTSIPNLLLWLKADSGVTFNGNAVAGWTDSGTAKVLAYGSQTGNFTAGLVLTGGTSGATGNISSDTDGGSTGSLVLTDVVGAFVSGEVITDSSTGSATTTAAPTSLAVVAGAVPPTYESSVVNSLPGLYFDSAKNAHLLLSDLPAQATAFEVFAVVKVDAFTSAAATLLNPPTASAAACLRVCLTNATVNRAALLRTSGPEYVSSATTTTSGKAIYRWRYNKGTTSGAAGLNATENTADSSFDETLVTWDSIGSRTGTTYALGGFRLCELIIFQVVQASTEEAMSISDVGAVLDYLNAKYGGIY